jgi:hypothetical protein
MADPVNTPSGIAPATPDIADRVEHHADAILRAAGSGLRHYTLPANRRAILSAMLDAYEEAYRAGAAFAESRLNTGANQ